MFIIQLHVAENIVPPLCAAGRYTSSITWCLNSIMMKSHTLVLQKAQYSYKYENLTRMHTHTRTRARMHAHTRTHPHTPHNYHHSVQVTMSAYICLCTSVNATIKVMCDCHVCTKYLCYLLEGKTPPAQLTVDSDHFRHTF